MEKYGSLRKSRRNKNLREYKDTHPQASWEAIGGKFNVSKQRAYEIYQNELRRDGQ